MDTSPCFAFADIVGFNNRNQFICKEFCFIDGDFEYHAIIKPPYSFNKLPRHEREMSLWEIEHLHGLEFQSGDVSVKEVFQNVFPHLTTKIIIVETSFKARALKNMFRNCGEIIDCISIQSLNFDMDLQTQDVYPICKHHNRILGHMACECAVATTHRLKEITTNNLELSEYFLSNGIE